MIMEWGLSSERLPSSEMTVSCITAGGTGKQHAKRHPTLGDRVMIGAGAKCLGNITIHDDAKVGANAVVISDVPAGSTFIGLAAKDKREKHCIFY